MPDAMVETVARRFRLLGEPVRLKLLQLLECGERTVNSLAEASGGNQANVSRHLTALYSSGLLSRRRDGASVYYSIADPVVFQLCDLVCRSAQEQARAQIGVLAAAAGTRSAKRKPRA
jgi:DNA-binding transcriptional ArsR family regulator